MAYVATPAEIFGAARIPPLDKSRVCFLYNSNVAFAADELAFIADYAALHGCDPTLVYGVDFGASFGSSVKYSVAQLTGLLQSFAAFARSEQLQAVLVTPGVPNAIESEGDIVSATNNAGNLDPTPFIAQTYPKLATEKVFARAEMIDPIPGLNWDAPRTQNYGISCAAQSFASLRAGFQSYNAINNIPLASARASAGEKFVTSAPPATAFSDWVIDLSPHVESSVYLADAYDGQRLSRSYFYDTARTLPNQSRVWELPSGRIGYARGFGYEEPSTTAGRTMILDAVQALRGSAGRLTLDTSDYTNNRLLQSVITYQPNIDMSALNGAQYNRPDAKLLHYFSASVRAAQYGQTLSGIYNISDTLQSANSKALIDLSRPAFVVNDDGVIATEYDTGAPAVFDYLEGPVLRNQPSASGPFFSAVAPNSGALFNSATSFGMMHSRPLLAAGGGAVWGCYAEPTINGIQPVLDLVSLTRILHGAPYCQACWNLQTMSVAGDPLHNLFTPISVDAQALSGNRAAAVEFYSDPEQWMLDAYAEAYPDQGAAEAAAIADNQRERQKLEIAKNIAQGEMSRLFDVDGFTLRGLLVDDPGGGDVFGADRSVYVPIDDFDSVQIQRGTAITIDDTDYEVAAIEYAALKTLARVYLRTLANV